MWKIPTFSSKQKNISKKTPFSKDRSHTTKKEKKNATTFQTSITFTTVSWLQTFYNKSLIITTCHICECFFLFTRPCWKYQDWMAITHGKGYCGGEGGRRSQNPVTSTGNAMYSLCWFFNLLSKWKIITITAPFFCNAFLVADNFLCFLTKIKYFCNLFLAKYHNYCFL